VPGVRVAVRPTSARTVPAPVSTLPAIRLPCGSCGSVRTTTISMTLTDGTSVDFTSCRACEHKTWASERGALALDHVLARATRRRA
jgi:hypothetical protein